MKKLGFILTLIALLGIGFAIDRYRSAQRAQQQFLLSQSERIAHLENEVNQEHAKLGMKKEELVQAIEDLKVKIQLEKNTLPAIEEALNRAKNRGTDSDSLTQVSREINQENQNLKDMDVAIQTIQKQRSSRKSDHGVANEQQKVWKQQQDALMAAKISDQQFELKTNELTLQTLRQQHYNPNAHAQALALGAQIQDQKHSLQVMQEQKRQFDLTWSSGKAFTEEQNKAYQTSLTQSEQELKARKEQSKKIIAELDRTLSDLQRVKDSQRSEIERLTTQLKDEKKKIQDLESQLQEAEDSLKAL